MQSRKARESSQQFLSLLSLLDGNECEHTDALAFGGESYEDSQRGADFARGPVRDLEVAQRPRWARRLSDSTRFHDGQSRRLAGWPCA
jgi:hypothetical protein